MTTLVRTTTLHRLSRRRYDGYENLERTTAAEPMISRTGDNYDGSSRGRRALSVRRTPINGRFMMTPMSYRRERARRRHIFLQGYKLTSMGSSDKLFRSRKLKKAVIKVKSMVVSILSFMRTGMVVKSCTSTTAIAAASPTPSPPRKCF